MAAKALLDRNPHPTRAEICDALDKNLCRCTGYAKVMQAIEAAAEGRQLPVAAQAGSPVGGSFTRPTPWPRPPARSATPPISPSRACSTPGCCAAPTPTPVCWPSIRRGPVPPRRRGGADLRDVPGARNHGVSQNDWPVLAYDKVRYYGDAVALVVAETPRPPRRRWP